ncbi:MAG: hypothetical protein COB22_08820 [Cycloclasticus sp.]|nr:MAG: hypothetical protein COB22_08820 [Cycloclasticus sp.]
MTKHLKILLLLIFVTVPALDIAFLDGLEASDQLSHEAHSKGDQEIDVATDIHCVCHVLHHGGTITKTTSLDARQLHIGNGPFEDQTAVGLHPKPGTPPPLA